MTTTVTRRTELAHRTSDGIDVYLFWNESTGRVIVAVLDARTDDSFELEVDGRHALDAFNHPYAYAARTDTAGRGAPTDGVAGRRGWGGDSKETTINQWRTDRARTDR
jgi:hypothetical protein